MNEIIRYAKLEDIKCLLNLDYHINEKKMIEKISKEEVIVYLNHNKIIGLLRFSYFWDAIPFMNLIMFEETSRHQGFGKKLVMFYEDEMKKKDKKMLLTSTLACEQAQHFYRKLGYQDCGALFIEKEGLEIIFKKDI